MIQQINIQAIPAQRFNVVLGKQNLTIELYQKGDYQYANIMVDGEYIRTGVICLVNTNLLSYPNASFTGVIFFVDLRDKYGTPNYEEYGTRYILCYSDEV